jgi:hypothetical protein
VWRKRRRPTIFARGIKPTLQDARVLFVFSRQPTIFVNKPFEELQHLAMDATHAAHLAKNGNDLAQRYFSRANRRNRKENWAWPGTTPHLSFCWWRSAPSPLLCAQCNSKRSSICPVTSAKETVETVETVDRDQRYCRRRGRDRNSACGSRWCKTISRWCTIHTNRLHRRQQPQPVHVQLHRVHHCMMIK